MSGRLTGKVAIVTGATAGIGHAIAHAFVAEGARVVAVARRSAPGERLVAELATATGVPGGAASPAVFVQGDVADPATADRAVGAAFESFGALDVLVNNAALDLSAVPLLETTPEQAREIFEVNVFGTFWMLLACARAMVEHGGGSIVNLTSRVGLVGLPGSAWYGASKGAVHALTRGAAVEWARGGIRVNSVAPGLTDTPMIKVWVESQDDPIAFRASRVDTIPQGRFATPEEVAAAVVYLASDESASTTGASISVDGGYTAA